MVPEDPCQRLLVGKADEEASVQPSRTDERGVEQPIMVACGQNDDALTSRDTVHALEQAAVDGDEP